jgi:hypothetical protein
MIDWFNLYVEIDEAFLRSECDGDGCREGLMLSCRGSELNTLLIGRNHIFNPPFRWDTEGRTDCSFRIWARRRSNLSEEASQRIGLGGDSVGEFKFWKELNSLEANIFIEDAMFERWTFAFLSMRHKISATITIALDQGFSERRTVGDESSVTWNIDGSATVSTARIRGWDFELTNRLWKESASRSQYK